MSGRSIRAAVANPRTASTTLSSCLSPAAARLAATCRPRVPLWHSSLPPWPGCPADHVLTEHRPPHSLHPASGADARRAAAGDRKDESVVEAVRGIATGARMDRQIGRASATERLMYVHIPGIAE